MQTQNINWRVSLSNGETFTEGIGIFAEVEGELSPWQKLLAYLEENSLQITSLVLVTKDNRTFNLPSLGNNPKFKPFRDNEKPIGYELQRYIAKEVKYDPERAGDLYEPRISDWYTVAVAVYTKYKLQLWVDEMDTRNCWVLVVPTA